MQGLRATACRFGAPLGAAVFLAGALLLNQVSVIALFSYLTYIGFVIVLPGTILWDVLMSRIERSWGEASSERSRLEDLVCGACAGYTIELAAYALARWVDAPRAYLVVPAAILAVGFVRWRRLGPTQVSPRPHWPAGASFALAGVVSYAVVWLGVRILPAYEIRPGGVYPDTDDPFQLALIGELRHHFPAIYPYVPDEPLAYQFFYHLHAAASTWATGLTPVESVARFDPVTFVVLAVAGAACIARRLTGRPWVGVLAAATLVLVGSFDVTGLFRGQANVEDRFLSALIVHAPTQTMAFALATPLILLAIEAVGHSDRRMSVLGWAVLFVLSVVMTGVKVTFTPMLLAGFAVTALLQSLARLSWRAAVTGAFTCAGAISLCVAVLYRGQSRGLSWEPLALARHYGGFFEIDATTLGPRTLIMASVLVGVLVPAAGVVGLMVGSARQDPRMWLLVSTAAAGLGAATLLGHPGLSQRYFLYSAAWPLAVASAWGLSELFSRPAARSVVVRHVGIAALAGMALLGVRLVAESHSAIRYLPSGVREVRAGLPGALNIPIIVMIVLVFLAVATVRKAEGERMTVPRSLVVVLVGLGLARTFAFVVGDQPTGQVLPRVPSGGLEVAAWLRDHSSTDDRVMTNAHCAPQRDVDPKKCDNRHFWMSALSERRFLLEGWGYVGTVVWEPYATYEKDPALLAENDQLFTSPSSAALKGFVRRHDVQWLLVDRAAPVDFAKLVALPEVRTVLDNRDFALLRVTPDE